MIMPTSRSKSKVGRFFLIFMSVFRSRSNLYLNQKLGVSFRFLYLDLNQKLGVSFQSSCPHIDLESRSKLKVGEFLFNHVYI